MDTPSGLKNNGVICWLNSVMQALLSSRIFCSSFGELSDESNTYREFRTLIKKINNKEDISMSSISILKALIYDLKRQQKSIDIGIGQQSSSEGLIQILDMLNNKDINSRFYHVYEDTVQCDQTGAVVSKVRSINNIFYIFDEETLLEKGLREFLLSHSSVLDEDFTPDNHEEGNTYRRFYTLRRMPEIVVIALNRYLTNGREHKKRNPNIKLPNEFYMPHNKEGDIKYDKIAEVHHMGGLNGGHYVSVAKRNNQTYLFNDEHVRQHTLETLTSTYLAFYEVSNIDRV